MADKLIVFIPCYNAEKYIGEALDSLLCQTWQNFKVVIADDGSTDRSRDIVKTYQKRDARILLHENFRNMGAAATRNLGWQLCDCEYMALMDADDIAVPKRLELEIEELERNPDIGAVGGGYQLMNEEGKLLPFRPRILCSDQAIRAGMIFFNPIANGSVMLRRSVVMEHGIRYSEENRTLEDYLFWCDFLRVSRIRNLDCVLQYYRISETSMENSVDCEERNARSRRFDLIHDKMYEMTELCLSEEEKNILKKATRDTSCLKGVGERIQFLKTLCRVNRQGKAYNAEFAQELKRISREYLKKECKLLIKEVVQAW